MGQKSRILHKILSFQLFTGRPDWLRKASESIDFQLGAILRSL
jgi:hypothetical protein